MCMYSKIIEPILSIIFNKVSKKYCNDYKFISFIGDDHLLQTYAWDKMLINPLSKKIGISYGNDLYKKEHEFHDIQNKINNGQDITNQDTNKIVTSALQEEYIKKLNSSLSKMS